MTSIARRDILRLIGLGGAIGGLPTVGTAGTAPRPATDKVRGIVLLVSDGMSPGVLTLAESWSRLTRGCGTAWCSLLSQPGTTNGLMDTASADSLVTDSAAASSAWGGGQRVNNGAINISPEGKTITPIGVELARKGGQLGLVTTATVTHATPAGFAAATEARGNENDIATQYLGVASVILGGGRGFFCKDYRPDKRDLASDFRKIGHHVHHHRDELLASKSDRLLGTYSLGHLPFTIDRDHSPDLAASVPTLAEMTEATLTRFLASEKPFLLQVEGARIDHAAHLNDIAALLRDQIAFDDAIAKTLALTAAHPDVLVIVTSDHGNSNPGLNGTGVSYHDTNSRFQNITRPTASFESIFTSWRSSRDQSRRALRGLIEARLGIQTTAEETKALANILTSHDITEWNHQLDKPEGLLGQIAGNHFAIGWTGTSHTADPTLITATGPQAARFHGFVKNIDLHTHFAELLL